MQCGGLCNWALLRDYNETSTFIYNSVYVLIDTNRDSCLGSCIVAVRLTMESG